MATFTDDIDLDFLWQVYDIRAVKSLAEFLLSGHSPQSGMAGSNKNSTKTTFVHPLGKTSKTPEVCFHGGMITREDLIELSSL